MSRSSSSLAKGNQSRRLGGRLPCIGTIFTCGRGVDGNSCKLGVQRGDRWFGQRDSRLAKSSQSRSLGRRLGRENTV